MKIEQDISAKVKSQVNQNQKEYYLREQMRAIQDELGIDEDVENEQNEWLKKLEELHLPEKTHQKIEKEIKRFTKMQPMSAQYLRFLGTNPQNQRLTSRELRRYLKKTTTDSKRSRTEYLSI